MDKILSPIKGRILQYIEFKGFEKKYFFETLQVAASNFRSSGLKSEVGGDVIAKILSFDSEINPEWLITGKGTMLRGSGNGANETVKSVNEMFLQEKIDLLTERIADKDDKITYQAKEILRLEKENKELRATNHDKSKPGGSVEFLDSPPTDPELKQRPQRQVHK